ncbi:MAG: formylglycine-generating enzyme family protein [Pseudomonadota bacterium]
MPQKRKRTLFNLMLVTLVMSMALFIHVVAGYCQETVANVRAQSQLNQVHVYYDLNGVAEKYSVTIRGSSDGGKTYDLPMKSLSGDIGGNVCPGKNKTIVWDATHDVRQLAGDNFVFEVEAAVQAETPAQTQGQPTTPETTEQVVYPSVQEQDLNAGQPQPPSPVQAQQQPQPQAFPPAPQQQAPLQQQQPLPTTQTNTFMNSLGMEFVLIQPGAFMMGSPSPEKGRHKDETQHQVTLTKGFYIQTTETTQAQWQAIMGSNPSNFKGNDRPVERVSWNDVQDFIQRLNQHEGIYAYRLPTEAEWEYACRGGTQTAYAFGDCISADLANYNGSQPITGCPGGMYRGQTVPAKSFRPNAWGLYEMHGNVWEWCNDLSGDYTTQSVTDPIGPVSGSTRVVRGGGWSFAARSCRSALRGFDPPAAKFPYIGFRVAKSLQ